MNDEIRAALDAIPVPAIRPVDVVAIYSAEIDRQRRSVRRWKRSALAIAALAAGVAVLALIPKLEIHASAYEFAIRWGTPPAPSPPGQPQPPMPDPRIPALVEEQQKQIVALRTSNANYAELQELVLALTADVASRDTAQKVKFAELLRELRSFQLATVKQFEQTEQSNTALYNVVFPSKPKTGG